MTTQKSEVADATRSHTFTISKEHIKKAKCKDPSQCVIAQALNDSMGAFFDGVEVGSTITKVYYPGRILRFATPVLLRKALKGFDETGIWDLPEGKYELTPPKGTLRLGSRPNRWARVSQTKTEPGRDTFSARAMPTRKVSRVAP